MSTETMRLIGDGEPGTATSTFTQLLSSEILQFTELCLSSTETIRLIKEWGAQDGHLDFHIQLLSSEILQFSVALRSKKPSGLFRDGEPRMATLTFTQLLGSSVMSVLLYSYINHQAY